MELTRLTGEEQALYDDLHSNNLGEKVRLEQERIGFEWLVDALGSV
ncbi:Wadjet anti-phage system protein JetD domain-containing protein [Chlorobium limicola]|nr:Wadjet anti-phage system protein JetD domain-containing protein [Chlorobium limicola]